MTKRLIEFLTYLSATITILAIVASLVSFHISSRASNFEKMLKEAEYSLYKEVELERRLNAAILQKPPKTTSKANENYDQRLHNLEQSVPRVEERIDKLFITLASYNNNNTIVVLVGILSGFFSGVGSAVTAFLFAKRKTT